MYSSRENYDRPVLHVFLLVLQIVFTCFGLVKGDDSAQEKAFYVVYMGSSSSFESKDSMVDAHVTLLSDVVGSVDTAKKSFVHSYNHFNAFAARFTPDEARELKSSVNVISVFPNQYRELHTTASWDFLGFPENVPRNLKFERDIVVGVIDTGITPDSESFSDEGFGPPPPFWKGTCGPFVNFSGCNNKLIGARYFKLDGRNDPQDILSPIDMVGHGTHTSSTVSGNSVIGANLFGLGNGTARGAVPSSKLAMYKVCWASHSCSDMDLLAAFDAAIEDGVHVISISLGGFGRGPHSYFENSLAIGAFHAMQKGIITVAAGGNSGPSLFTVDNHAPWILTVAASGTSRQYRSKVKLGNGKILSGLGINTFTPQPKLYPLITGEDAGFETEIDYYDYPKDPRICMEDSLDTKKVKGKVVLCESSQFQMEYPADIVVSKAGGVGTIVVDSEGVLTYNDTAAIYFSPATTLNGSSGEVIYKYINSTRSPAAIIYKTEAVSISAPFVASFSSRGPSTGSRRVLKPDIAAPGTDILAAYPPSHPITYFEGDPRRSKYNILSGTSMACPHVAGVAAYVKSFHPNWSPAAIKSAILTTATPMSATLNSEAEFAYGTGQVNPLQAVDPGLVFDMDERSYIKFLCQEGYSSDEIINLSGTKMNCPELPPKGYDALNYPTMHLRINATDQKPQIAIFRRTVTNMGPKNSIYKATIKKLKKVKMTVKPKKLVFTKRFQKISFTVAVKLKKVTSHTEIISGSVTWTSSRHTVRSPVVIFTE
ncbi:hypothetical protein MKW98_007208 [Papaver atlanticum]|uniref:Uncharacterized protein n=1 Tax=Papaver atlanticum TaxID=357466 RepID=A0AAD4XFU7_9MAGN|nr:hypothetical protein MKW98_007208 [Papaver atlanticum]